MSEEPTATAPPATRPGRGGGRPLWIVVLLLVVGAGLLWGTSRMTWQWSTHVSDLRGTVVDAANGSDVETGLVPLALIYLAAIAATMATGGWARRLVGGLLALAGVAALWLGLHRIAGVFAEHQSGYPFGTVLAAHIMAVVAGLAGVAAGTLLVRHAARMPRMGAKYSRQDRRGRKDPDTALWDDLTEGSDPTSE